MMGARLKKMEREVILSVLHNNRGSRVLTAKALEMPYRSLTHKLSIYRSQGYDVPPSPPRESFGRSHDWPGSSVDRAVDASGARQVEGSSPSPVTSEDCP